MDAWERRPGEGAKAYAAFIAYRDLGPRGRSVTRVSQERHAARGLIGRWSAQHEWVARAEAWDAERQRRADEAVREARERATHTHEQAARVLLSVALRHLHPPPTAAADWRPQPQALQAATGALDKAIHHQRLALGLPTDVTQQQVIVKQALGELAAGQQTINRLLEEHLCGDCRARLAPELRRVWEHTQRALALVG